MNKLLISISILLSVSACSPELSGNTINRAVSLCESKGGVYELLAPQLFIAGFEVEKLYTVECANGESLSLYGPNMKKTGN